MPHNPSSTVKLDTGRKLPRLGDCRSEELARLDGLDEDLSTGWEPTDVP